MREPTVGAARSLLDLCRLASRALVGRAQPLRVLLALGSLMALCAWRGQPGAVIPLFLGVIASALAETDDSWQGRSRAQCVTLICFAAAAGAVASLIGAPILFGAFLALAAFLLTMMGAVEARYKSIGFATLVLVLYATIGLDGKAADAFARQQEPLLLLAGAAWYGVLSIASAAAFPAQAVQAQLVKLFAVLGTYVHFKASLFEPLRDIDIEQKRLALAHLNAKVVAELNAAKDSILRRLGPGEPTGRIARYRGLYLIAQDVHERASSSHDDYHALADAFFHSDLLYRCQRVLDLQADACSQLAHSIARREPFVMNRATLQALNELRSAIDHQREQAATAERGALLASVEALADNLVQLDAQLAGASQPTALVGRKDTGIADTSPHSWREMGARVRRQLSPESLLFRHALRLAIALSVGYAVKLWVHPAQGYWILLTTLFVCQQNYGETVSRLGKRTAGTVIGVVTGWALLDLFPQPSVQALLAVAAGVLFFATRVSRYLVATAAITVLVLMCFNQVGDSEVLIVPRLVDTAIGSLIAWLAVLLVFPHWQSRRFGELAVVALLGQAGYLRQIARQYAGAERDDLAYRVARRSAHDADAALSAAVVEMHREPGHARPHADVALRFLIQSHTLMNYLSALGAHRVAMPDAAAAAAFSAASEAAASALADVAAMMISGLKPGPPGDARTTTPTAEAAGARARGEAVSPARLLRTELRLIWLQIDALERHAREWLAVREPD